MPTGNEVEVTFCLTDGTKLTRIENLADITTFLEQHEEYVKIVRCKDCKWYGWGLTECHNPRYGDGWANYPPPQVYDEYFCKDGEREVEE